MKLENVSELPEGEIHRVNLSASEVPREQIQNAKEYNRDSELFDYIDRNTVGVWHSSNESQYLLSKVEQDTGGGEGYSEVSKAIFLGDLGVSPEVHFYDEAEISGLSGEYYMDFLRDYAPVEDTEFNGLSDFNNYVTSVGEAMGVLDQLNMVHGDLVRDRKGRSGVPQLRNLMFDGDSYDVKIIDPETLRFYEESEEEFHRLSRAEGNSVIKEQEAPSHQLESQNVWKSILVESLFSLDGFGRGVDLDKLREFETAGKGNQELPSINVEGYFESGTDEIFFEFQQGLPKVNLPEDVSEDSEIIEFATGVSRIADSYTEGYLKGQKLVREQEGLSEPEELVAEIDNALH